MPLSLFGRSSPRRSRKSALSEEPDTARSDPPARKSWSRSLSRSTSRLTRSLSAMSLGRSWSLQEGTQSSSFSDVRGAEERFEVLEEIGRGAFSTVVLARKRQPPDEGCLFAMKVCQKKEPGTSDRRKPPNSKAEPFILGFLRSKEGPGSHFVIGLRYAFQAQDAFYLVTDHYRRGSLETLLKRRRGSVESTTKAFAELVVALTFLHAHGVVHRDCKPSNILIDDRGHCVVADFGLAALGKDASTGCRSFCGSVEYMAPEILRGRPYGAAVDWWALGILIGELCTGDTPFHAEQPRQLMASILNDTPVLPADEALAVTLGALLEKDASLRPSARDVRAAPAFASTDWGAVEALAAPPFPEDDGDGLVPFSAALPAAVSRVTTSPESSLEATTASDVRRVASEPLLPPPPPRSGDTVSPRAWASRSPAAVVETDSEDDDDFFAAVAPAMPRAGADRYAKPRLETLAVCDF